MKRIIKATALILSMGAIFMFGKHIGKTHTIHNAQLDRITPFEYHINFDGDIHVYTFDETISKIEMTESGTLYTFTDGTGYYAEN